MRAKEATLFFLIIIFAGFSAVAEAHPENTCNHCVHHCHYNAHSHQAQAPQTVSEPPQAAAAPVSIQSSSPLQKTTTRHRHEGGFLRILGGVVKHNEGEGGLAFDDGAVWQLGEVALGGTSNDGLSWHLTLALSSWEPPAGQANRFDSHHNGNIYMGIVGMGFTSHWMPGNFYMTASVGRSFKTQTAAMERSELDSLGKVRWHSVGVSAAIGKEWWISSDLGLGVAVQGIMLNTEEGRYIFGGPVLSMTYN